MIPKPGKKKTFKQRRPQWTKAFKEAAEIAWERVRGPDNLVRCEECGFVLIELRNHNADHKVAAGMGGTRDNDPDNIRIVCYFCHTHKTTGKRPKGENWLDR